MAKKLLVFFMAFMMVFGAAAFAGCERDDETSLPQRPITGDEVGEDPDTENPDKEDKNEDEGNPDAGDKDEDEGNPDKEDKNEDEGNPDKEDKNEDEGNPDAGDKNEGDENPDVDDKNEDVQDHSKDLVIALSSLTKDAQFFGITVDGTYMEVIAYKYGSTYRTAFNTCQVCYGSRTAYFKQSGNYLVCQNCKNKFALSSVGLATSMYTCSPYPILETDRTVEGDNMIISYEFLVQTRNLFKTWKVT